MTTKAMKMMKILKRKKNDSSITDDTENSTNHDMEEAENEEEPMSLGQYLRGMEKAFLENLRQDEVDVERCMARERKFTVAYNRLSRNEVWATKEGDRKDPFEATVEEYKAGQEIWPRGRHLDDLSAYGQIWDYFCFQWKHTKPYSTVFMIMLMSIVRPFQNTLMATIAQQVEEDPSEVPFRLYLAPFFVDAFGKALYWWYEMWVPLNSQRVQLRSVLLSQRIRIPIGHPMTSKWPSGRFNGLLKDVDDVVNQVWKSCLDLFDDFVTIVYLFALVFADLYANDSENDLSYGAYIGLFMVFAILAMAFPFIWFHFFQDTVQECEWMVREGQALYLSVSSDAIVMAAPKGGTVFNDTVNFVDLEKGVRRGRKEASPKDDFRGEATSRKAYRVYGLTTFRAFFHRLAWTTNFSLIISLFGPVTGYVLLSAGTFGETFNLSSTLILLLSLRDIGNLSHKLLNHLLTMVRGLSTLQDVAELLNTKIDLTQDGASELGSEDGEKRRHRRQEAVLY